MTTSNASPRPAEALSVELYDAYYPALTAGTHRIVVQQSVDYRDAAGTAKTHHYYRDDAFVVRGPRFFVDENDIHARYPAVGAAGDFHRHIPNIVLRKRALPWERQLDLGQNRRAPWMALFLLTETEFQAQGGETAIRVVKPDDLFVSGRTSADGRALLPKLKPEPGDDAKDLRVNVIDLGRSLVQQLCPSLADLQLLVHVRKVGMDNKPRQAMHGAGEFPVVSARRIPAPGANIAMLVSLEGWEDLIEGTGKGPLPAGPDRLRLVMLARWRFNHDPAYAHSFAAIARSLRTDTLRVVSPDRTPSELARPLGSGYTPMPYRMADGRTTLAWYRGPFAAAPVAPLPVDTFSHADAALIVSPEDGSLTLSYAAAWQLGRLMGLSSPTFLAATRAFVDKDAGPREVAFRLDTFMCNHLKAIQREWSVEKDPLKQLDEKESEPRGHFRAAMTMLGWLESLLRLEGIPFHYLVAGENLLPVGTVRYFHIDANWVLALANGALSLSGTGTSDKAAAGFSMRCLVSRIMERCLAGASAKLDPKGQYLDQPRTGFLLRSTLVSDWPGLETLVATRTGSARPTRLERLGNDILLGIAEEQIASLTFKEPPESLVFSLRAEREGVPEPDKNGLFSPLARRRAEAGLNLPGAVPATSSGKPPDPLSPAAFAAASMSSGSIQTFVWENKS